MNYGIVCYATRDIPQGDGFPAVPQGLTVFTRSVGALTFAPESDTPRRFDPIHTDRDLAWLGYERVGMWGTHPNGGARYAYTTPSTLRQD